MDIAFVCAPASRDANKYHSNAFAHTLGTGYIIAYLREHGFTAEQFVSHDYLNAAECAKAILSLSPRTVGLTVYDASWTQSVLIAHELKRLAPSLIVIFGGPTPSVQAGNILARCSDIDLCVRKEGEETTLELMRALHTSNFKLRTAALAEIRGLTWRNGNRVVNNPEREFPLKYDAEDDALDRYPSPYLTGIIHDCGVGVITARGCNQNCTFCSCATMSERRVLTHSVKRVVDELEVLSHSPGPFGPTISILDDAFTLFPARVRSICEEIIRRDMHLSLRCVTRCDRVDRELLELMREAHFDGIGFALESATPRVLRQIGKVQKPSATGDPSYMREREFVELFKENAKHAKDLGMFVFASVMTGLPDESLEEGQSTLDLIRGLDLDFYGHNILSIYSGTPLFNDHLRFGIMKVPLPNGIQYRTLYAYDPYRIRMAPKSNLELAELNDHRADMKVLALCPEQNRERGFFTSVVLDSDRVDEELILWLREQLAINGRILQIYSSAAVARQLNERNRMLMNECELPTLTYGAYYRELDSCGRQVLRSYNALLWNGQCDIPIFLLDWEMTAKHERPDAIATDGILLEFRDADTRSLYDVLAGMGERGEVAVPALPFLTGLCRWECGGANCQTLETIIVDAAGAVKTCWSGAEIGRVGDSFEQLRASCRMAFEHAEARRDCAHCDRHATCVKCPFPSPMDEEEYCTLRRRHDVAAAAHRMRSADVLKNYAIASGF